MNNFDKLNSPVINIILVTLVSPKVDLGLAYKFLLFICNNTQDSIITRYYMLIKVNEVTEDFTVLTGDTDLHFLAFQPGSTIWGWGQPSS